MDVKAKVLRGFRDAKSPKRYKKNEVHSFTKERFDEINAHGKDKPYLELETMKPAGKPAADFSERKDDL